MATIQRNHSDFNVLLSNTHWNWPQAVSDIFQPRGVNAMMVSNADEIVRIARDKRIHLAIVDSADQDEQDGVRIVKVLRHHYKSLPCILLASGGNKRLLTEALNLNVFSVLNKPVDLALLAEQLDRIFKKYYESDLFSSQNGRTISKLTFLRRLHGRPLGKIIVKWFNK